MRYRSRASRARGQASQSSADAALARPTANGLPICRPSSSLSAINRWLHRAASRDSAPARAHASASECRLVVICRKFPRPVPAADTLLRGLPSLREISRRTRSCCTRRVCPPTSPCTPTSRANSSRENPGNSYRRKKSRPDSEQRFLQESFSQRKFNFKQTLHAHGAAFLSFFRSGRRAGQSSRNAISSHRGALECAMLRHRFV